MAAVVLGFSLGHLTVLSAFAILFAIGIKALAPQVRGTASTLHNLASR